MAGVEKSQSPHFMRGVICSLLGAVLWGFSGTCAQLLLSQYHIPVLFIVCIRMISAGLLFLIVILISKRKVLIEVLKSPKTLLQLTVFGVCGFFLCHLTYLMCIDYTNAGTATVLQCLGILFVMIYTCLYARRLPRVRETVGFLLAAGSTFIIATHANPAVLVLPLPGLLWGIACGLAVAFYMIFPKALLIRWGSLIVTGLGMLIGGIVVNIVLRPWTMSVTLEPGSLAALAAIVLFGTFAAFYLYLQGIADIGPLRASLLGAAEPVSATIFSWAWLGTHFPLIDCVGFALMIAMVFLVTNDKPAAVRPDVEDPALRERKTG